jgi:hypothetical protein
LHILRVIRFSQLQKDHPVNTASTKNAGRTALISGAVSCWLIYDMATASEAPSQGVMILQYGLLALSLIGLIGSVIMLANRKRES